MNFRNIALALVVTSPTLLASAENVRKARELAPLREQRRPSRPQSTPSGPQSQPSRPESPPQQPQSPPSRPQPGQSEEDEDGEVNTQAAPAPQTIESRTSRYRTQSTQSMMASDQAAPPGSPGVKPANTDFSRTSKRQQQKTFSVSSSSEVAPAYCTSCSTSTISSSFSPTNDCVMYPILKPWRSKWGYCESYDPSLGWDGNFHWCDEDFGKGDFSDVLAEDACPQCRKCKGPENFCVAFSNRNPFDYGYGTCDTYRKGHWTRNHYWCAVDEVNGITAFQACAECGGCVGSNPRTVKVKLLGIKANDEGDDWNDNVELVGDISTQLGKWSRMMWKNKGKFWKIDVGEFHKMKKIHFYHDVADWETLSVKGTMREYDYGPGGYDGYDDIMGFEKESFDVGELYHDKVTKMATLTWDDWKGNDIRATFSIEVF